MKRLDEQHETRIAVLHHGLVVGEDDDDVEQREQQTYFDETVGDNPVDGVVTG